MVIAKGKNEKTGDDLLLMGLSHENMARLLKGEPISFSRKSHGDSAVEGLEIIITVGPTEEDIKSDLMRSGLVGDMTNIFRDDRLK